MRKVMFWMAILTLLSGIGWSLAARIAPHDSRATSCDATQRAVAAAGVANGDGANGYFACHTCHIVVESLTLGAVGDGDALTRPSAKFSPHDTVGILATLVERGDSPRAGSPLPDAQVVVDVTGPEGAVITSLEGLSDELGQTLLKWQTSNEQATGRYTAKVVNAIKKRYKFDSDHGTTTVTFEIR